MSSIVEALAANPVEYIPTGDKGLLVAWVATEYGVRAVLCLEDGRPIVATTEEFKFDYRWDGRRQKWLDVSVTSEGEDDVDTDQEDADDGGPGVS